MLWFPPFAFGSGWDTLFVLMRGESRSFALLRMTAAGIGKAQNPELRIEQVELFAWFEANRFSGGDGDFGSGTRVAADAGFAWADIEDAEAAQLDAIAIGKGLFQAFKYGIDRGFSLIARKTRTLDDVMDNVLFYQRVHPLLQGIACIISGYQGW